MTILASPIQYGSYIMPIGTILKSQALDSTIEDTPLLGGNGSYAPPGWAMGAVITLSCEMGGGGDVSPTTSLPMVTMDDTTNELNLIREAFENGYQALKVGTSPPRYIMAQKRKFDITPLPGSNRSHVALDIELYAQDPRWLSSTTNSVALSGAFSVTNAGTARSYPVITVTSGTNPQILIAPPPGRSAQIGIQLTYTLGTGDTIVIDCDPRNRANAVLLNGTPRLDLLGTAGLINNLGTSDLFPFLDPGISSISVTGASGTFAWHDAWGV